MKKHWKSAIALVSSLVMICVVVVFFILENPLQIRKMEEKAVPAETSESVAKKLNVMDEDFVILEIVPDISYSKLGFLQTGSEPVDMMEACKDGHAENIQKIAGDSSAIKLVSTIDGNAYEQLQSDYQFTDEEMSQYWTLVSSGSSIKSKQKYQFADGKKYAMNQNSLRSILPSSEVSVNDDIIVVTLTASEINGIASGDLNAFLDKVDLFYVSQTYAMEEQKSLITNYGKEKDAVSGDTVTFLNQDLSWNVVHSIFSFVGKKSDPTPIVLDKSLYEALEDGNSAKNVTTTQYSLNRTVKYASNMNSDIIVDNDSSKKDKTLFLREKNMLAGTDKVASSNNAFKLYLMCAFRDPAEFYNLFIESKVITETGENQIQSGDARSYWNTYSFLPAKKEMKASDHSKGDADYWKNDMKIALSGEEVPMAQYCVISCDTKEAVHTLEKALKSVCEYEPMSAYVDGEKRSYEVLEIEPAASISDKNEMKGFSETMEAKIEALLPYTGYTTKETFSINVTQMTTSHFISKRNSLTSDYDLIYIGANTGGLRTTKDSSDNTVTDYGSTDSNKKLRGIIYSHIGSFVNFDGSETSRVGHNTPSGVRLFSSSSGGRSLRYSGTDITTIRKDELNKYVNVGLPVVISSNLLDDVKAGESNYKKYNSNTYVNSKYFSDVDENNMYQFIKAQKENVVTSDYNYRTDDSKFLERLVYEKPSMKLNYIKTSAGQKEESGFDKNKTYMFSKGSRTRQFTLNISVSSGSEEIRNFTGNLYVDKNADGVYAASERVASKKFMPNGNSANLTFNLNPNYHGAFTWRLVVYPTGLSDLACTQTGYGNIKFSDSTEKDKVYVLQVQAMPGNTTHLMKGESSDITQHYDKEYDETFIFNKYHGTVWGCDQARTINIEKDFKEFYSKLDDYDIDVTLINLEQFCSSSGWKDGSKTYTKNTFGNHYNMLVFGFADSYRDMEMDKETAVAVQKYIDSKKSVMFTHDLTSPSDLSSDYKWDVYISRNRKERNGAKLSRSILGETNPFVAAHYYFVEVTNGKGFNRYLRDAMGLNRYKQDKKVSSEYSSDYYTTHKNLLRSDEEFYGYTYTTLMQNSNFRRISSNNSNSKAESKGLWGPYKGLVINIVDDAATPDDGRFYDVVQDSIIKKTDGDGIPWIGNGNETHYVTSVNEGQITKYPFDLSGDIAVSAEDSRTGLAKYKVQDTHGQAFQLNVEDPNVVCWFALADSENTDTNWYDTSPNDASNNYYIYNKGNVTYTGVGHRGGLSDFEKKLFVNTFVASLKAGVAGPQPEITNGYAVSLDNGDYQVVYADVDSDSTDSEFNKNENVDFYITDDSTSSNYVYVSLEMESKDAVDGYKEIKKEDGISIVAKNGGEISGPVTMTDSDGKQHLVWKVRKTDLSDTGTYEYTIKYPRAGLKTESLLKFRLYAYADNSGELGIQGVQNGAIMRRAHFRLD